MLTVELLALVPLRLLQRRDGRGADRADAGEGAHRRLFARLQSRHDARRLSPLISTWLIQHTGDKAAPGYWLSFAALCGLVATLALYRGRAGGPEVASRPVSA